MAEENIPPEVLSKIKKISDTIWEIPTSYKKGMLVPVRIVATKKLLDAMEQGVFEQATNVAMMPGIKGYSFAMADAHQGYGMVVGGVAAFDINRGVISPGAVGYDISCSMRLIKTNLSLQTVLPKIKQLVDNLYKKVPAGVGGKAIDRFTDKELDEMVVKGVKWCVDRGYGWPEDIDKIEEHGCINGADPLKVSDRAKQRGKNQVGTLGSGNHYLEVQVVTPDRIYNKEIANAFGITGENQIFIMVHCGSRGYGHQIATDYLSICEDAMKKYNISVPDRELACVPFQSKEGQDYFKAMTCAANFSFCNRQIITHRIREAFEEVFGKRARDMDMGIIYDVAHNIAKVEEYEVDGKKQKLVVHRKGATRAFGPGNNELFGVYKKYGQPVIVGGSMQTGSYLLVGTQKAEQETFGSTLHGSGRTMSRTKARKIVRGDELQKEMENAGIYVKSVTSAGLAEEAGIAYKDINEVVKAVELAGISIPVVSFKPIGNVKG